MCTHLALFRHKWQVSEYFFEYSDFEQSFSL